MDAMPVVSVIVPVHNAAAYLDQTLGDIRRQRLRDIEIICVDDGSTDGSVALLRQHAADDPRIRVIEHEHSNAGAVRNLGLDVASGRYLSFLDADDRFAPDMLARLVAAAESGSADVVVGGASAFDHASGARQGLAFSVRALAPGRTYEQAELVEAGLFQAFFGWAWDKLFRREFVVEQGLRFQEIESTNDAFFVYSALASAARVAVVGRTLVFQRVGVASSIGNSVRRSKAGNLFRAAAEIEARLERDGRHAALLPSFAEWLIGLTVWNMERLDGAELEAFVELARERLLVRFTGPDRDRISPARAEQVRLLGASQSELAGLAIARGAELDGVYRSGSWRASRPLRAGAGLLRRLRRVR